MTARLFVPGYFSTLPVELVLLISANLTLKDRLSLADTCRTCRSSISDSECIRACMKAGLSIPPNISARAVAKLLCRPRICICNWSYEGGMPKKNLDFSEVHSISSTVGNDMSLALHPVVSALEYRFSCETTSFEKVSLRVGKNEPTILLCRSRLYLNEYATSPPLDELHVMIQVSLTIPPEDVIFRIRNPAGITVGNVLLGFFRFLHQAPDPTMSLTQRVLNKYAELKAAGAVAGIESPDITTCFVRDCPTNLAMLDVWCFWFQNVVQFSERRLGCTLEYNGALRMVISAHPSFVANYFAPLELIDIGEPRRKPREMTTLASWKDIAAAPLVEF